MDEMQEKLNKIFFPSGMRRYEKFKRKRKSLAYYTTAETAKKILENNEIWMRNASVMNDFSEIKFGIDRLRKLLFSAHNDNLFYMIKQSLSSDIFAAFCEALDNFFGDKKRESGSWQFNTYITCFTEHSEKENQDGRLSMWRAYGGDDGAAIVFKKGILFDNQERKDIHLSPVEYADEYKIVEKIKEIVNLLSEENDYLSSIYDRDGGKEIICDKFMWILRFAAVSLKHPGFREEAEWRLVAHGQDLEKDRKNFVVESVRGIDQPIYKIKLKPDELFDLIDHIIIGPKADIGVRNVMCKAFVRLISDSFGVNDNVAEKKVKTSTIPYRPTL